MAAASAALLMPIPLLLIILVNVLAVVVIGKVCAEFPPLAVIGREGVPGLIVQVPHAARQVEQEKPTRLFEI